MQLFWGRNEIEDSKFRMLNLCISVVPLMMALFYPKVGSILGIAASLSGFLMIYVVPVLAYMKMKKLEISNPLLAAALQENEVEVFVPNRNILPKSFNLDTDGSTGNTASLPPMSLSPKIAISDRFLKRHQISKPGEKSPSFKADEGVIPTASQPNSIR